MAFTGRRADLGAEVASVTGASFIQGDAGNADDAANTVATAIEQLGGLDILMNNAGAPAKPAPFEDLSWKISTLPWRSTCRAYWPTASHAAYMQAQKSGCHPLALLPGTEPAIRRPCSTPSPRPP